MRLEINILWFEDALDELTAGISRLKRHIKKEGYALEIESYGNLAKIDELSQRQKAGHEFDLIVVDYNLLDGALGTDVASAVRQVFPFTRILFYSGGFDRTQLREMMARQGVEGVFCEARASIVDRLQEIIDTIVADNNRLAGMRGLAAEVIGRCDEHLRTALRHLAAIDHDTTFKKVKEKAEETSASTLRNLAKCTTLEQLLASRAVTSMHLFMATKSLSKERIHAEVFECFDTYSTEALGVRNKLSHAVQIQQADGTWSLGGDTGLSIDDFPMLRSNFQKHLINCSLIVDQIAAHVPQKTEDGVS